MPTTEKYILDIKISYKDKFSFVTNKYYVGKRRDYFIKMILNTNYFIENNKQLSKYILEINSNEYKKFINVIESRFKLALEKSKIITIRFVKTKKILKEI